MYAVKDRVPSAQKACNQAQKSGPQQSLHDLEMKEFLPTFSPAYEPSSNDVVRHIPHYY